MSNVSLFSPFFSQQLITDALGIYQMPSIALFDCGYKVKEKKKNSRWKV